MGVTMRLAVLLAAVLTGCATITPEQKHAEEMLTAASALTKVAAAAEASVRYGNPPENLPDAEFLQFATAHDPELLQPFSGVAHLFRGSGQTGLGGKGLGLGAKLRAGNLLFPPQVVTGDLEGGRGLGQFRFQGLFFRPRLFHLLARGDAVLEQLLQTLVL